MSTSISIAFRKRLILLGLAGAVLLGLGGCMLNDTVIEAPKIPEKAFLFSLNSDYKVGNYSAFGIDSQFTNKEIETIFSDAAVRYFGGQYIFVLNRLGRDNLQIIDRKTLKTVSQIAFKGGDNPYDIAIKGDLAYVAFFGSSKIGVYKWQGGEKVDSIDLAAYADKTDSLPETSELRIIGGTLYAVIANLQAHKFYAPTLEAKLAKINLATKNIEILNLPYGNPDFMAYDSAANKVYIPCRGKYSNDDFSIALDGGIVGVSLAKFAVVETVATEAALKGNVNKVLLHNGHLYMDLSSEKSFTPVERVLSIDVKDGKAEDLLELDGYSQTGMDIDALTETLYLGDRKNGLRIVDLKTGKEKSDTKISLGALPINNLAVIR